MEVRSTLNGVLILMGLGFMIADARIVLDYLNYVKRRRTALGSPKSPSGRVSIRTISSNE